jgi:hypothetical protein
MSAFAGIADFAQASGNVRYGSFDFFNKIEPLADEASMVVS